MSEEADGDSRLPTSLRTVTPPSGTRPNGQMNVIGWSIFLGLLFLLLPVLPVLLVVWLISRTRDAVSQN